METSNRHDRIAEDAAEWCVTLQAEVTREQREQYVDWLRESPLHVAEMLRVAQVHDAIGLFERWATLPTEGATEDNVVSLPAHRVPQDEPRISERRRHSVLGRMGAAAAALAVLILGVVFLAMDRGQLISTERGERREVALTDGSVVQVDPETELRIHYDAHSRHVWLVRGRALFHVAKNPKLPFLVQARGTTVRAVGTAFAVDEEPQSLIVTVAEGQVAVFATPGTTSATGVGVSPSSPLLANSLQSPGTTSSVLPLDSLDQLLLLKADEQVEIPMVGSAKLVQHVDSDRTLAWAHGQLVFNQNTVQFVVSQFNRYNRIQLSVANPALAQQLVSGVFDAADPESFLAFLQTVAPVRVSRNSRSDITIDLGH